MKVIGADRVETKAWELGDIIGLGKDFFYYTMVVQSGHEVMLVDLESGRPIMYMGVLMHISNPLNGLTSLREKLDEVTSSAVHYPKDMYAIKLVKLKGDL